jgi:hypothetical protein
MTSISTGVGLCVLSATIAACFSISHLGVETKALAIDVHDPSGDETTLTMASLSLGCSSQIETWFNPIPKRLNRCLQHYESNSQDRNLGGRVGTHPLGICDVNGDGIQEVFDLLGKSNLRADLPILIRSSAETTSNEETLLVHRPVLTNSTATTQAVLALLGYTTWPDYIIEMHVTASGWRDLDADGDQDLVCNVTYRLQGTGSCGFDIWFENTGYTAAPPPNPYDLDQDGEVGAGDISVLLLNFD